MPKAFLLKRNFGADVLELPSPLNTHRVKLEKDVDQGIRPKIYHQKKEIDVVSQQKGKCTYPAEVFFDVSLKNAAKNLSLETDCINNKRKSSGAVDARTHSLRDGRLKACENSKRPRTYNDSDGSTLFSSSGEEDETQINCIGINKASKQKINQIKKERANKAVHRCDQCGKVFKTKYTLSIHLKMPDHTESRPFVCNICGKGFRLSSTLCRHKIIHTQKKPHKCETCNKCFNRSSTLKTHIRTHSDNKAFICDVCGKGFHQKGNLRNHIMIHTGEKPFKCPKCQRAFNKMSNLKFHMHTHTDNLPYQCKVCRERFTKKYELKQHNDEMHE